MGGGRIFVCGCVTTVSICILLLESTDVIVCAYNCVNAFFLKSFSAFGKYKHCMNFTCNMRL